MLVDDITINVTAGRGGKGAVAFQKNLMSLGPTGGRGGRGGSVYAIGVPDIGALSQFRHIKTVRAKDGEPGRIQLNDGTAGEDQTIRVPVGTVIHNLELENKIEITKIGEKVLIAKGGIGGKGNFGFRSPTNTSPKQSQPGMPGESFHIRLELKLIADVGLVGLPNAGKSSLLNSLTNAKSKVANYPFTTLEPNLGTYYDLILADIPGIIEGASAGKGLGIKFLRHIERTRSIFHLVAADSEDPIADFNSINKELANYSKELAEKEQFVFVSKCDLSDKKKIAEIKKKLQKYSKKVYLLSVLEPDYMEDVKKILQKIQKEKNSK